MEQRAYTQIGADTKRDGSISPAKIAEVGEVVATQVRLAQELGAEVIRTVATKPLSGEAKNCKQAVKEIARTSGVDVDVLSEEEEGRLAFVGATKTLGHPVDGDIGVVDVGGGSCEIIIGTVANGVHCEVVQDRLRGAHRRFPPAGPAFGQRDPQARDHIDDFFDDVDVPKPRPGRGGRRATSLRTLVGAVLEYETLERGVRVLAGDSITDVAKRFELDPRRVRILPSGVLCWRSSRAAGSAPPDRQGRPARGDHPRPPGTAPPTARPSSAWQPSPRPASGGALR